MPSQALGVSICLDATDGFSDAWSDVLGHVEQVPGAAGQLAEAKKS